MMPIRTVVASFALAGATAVLVGHAAQTGSQQAQPPAQPRQGGDVVITISGAPGLPPKYAVPDFIALTNDAESVAAAKTLGQVLWDDLNFEREFYLIPRDTYRTIPQAASIDQVPLDRWRELGADGVVVGSIRKNGNSVVVQVRLLEVGTGRSAFAKEYSGSIANPRLYAHTISDEIHLQQSGLKGVARTKLAFTSDRDGERIKGPVADRGISNIYMSDYDGANERRVTVTRSLDIAPAWSPDGRALAYTSYRSNFPDIIVQYVYEARQYTKPAAGTAEKQNYLPAWSPDGTRIAFMSNRDGNNEIYVVNRDGTGMRRLTNHPAIDVTPTWSPAPFNEIAYASRSGGGYDIRVFDFATRSSRTVTDGIGSNESPAFSPNGRHIAFTATRAGKEQIFTIARDGKDLRQLTRNGSNRYPNWSQSPQ